MIKEQIQVNRLIKNVLNMNHSDKSDLDPQVDLDVEGVLIPHVVIEFGSQVNILPKTTWIKLGHPKLEISYFYLKLANQGLLEPMVILKDVDMPIIGIPTRIEF